MVLSGIIIARNEEDRIESCIRALYFCDEVLVVDNGSVDDTVSIAQKAGARVIPADGLDFSQLRSLSIDEARGYWVFYADADEIVSPELASQIKDAVHRGYDGFTVRRVNYFLSTRWRKEEHMLRLFKKSSLKGWTGPVHETPQFSGSTGHLSGELIHNTHRNLSEMAEKTNEWSEIEARLRFEAHHPPVVWWRILRVMWTGFFDSYIKQKGYSVGMVGIIESMFQAYSMFATYAKLWELQQNEKNTK